MTPGVSPKLAAVCADVGITIVDTVVRRGPRETCAVRTLERILALYGENHLKDVLLTIIESENNARELTAPIISAVSDVRAARPGWCEQTSKWLEAFDAISLGEMREKAKAYRPAVGAPASITTMLLERLTPVFGEDERQGRLAV